MTPETPFPPAPRPAARDVTKTLLMRRIQLLESELTNKDREAEKDHLTRLGNKLGLERRTSARGGWFVLCDLDGFKRAQDAHPAGHAYGDLVLIEFANFLRSVTRTDPGRAADRVAARTGGDEFVIWVPTKEAAVRVKLMVRAWLSEDGAVSASVGMGQDLAAADAAMYLDKRAKKRRWLADLMMIEGLTDGVRKVLKSVTDTGRLMLP